MVSGVKSGHVSPEKICPMIKRGPRFWMLCEQLNPFRIISRYAENGARSTGPLAMTGVRNCVLRFLAARRRIS